MLLLGDGTTRPELYAYEVSLDLLVYLACNTSFFFSIFSLRRVSPPISIILRPLTSPDQENLQ
uniref:Uncharacterized protein n=1 Tax=Picea sitchensis TaxID=3332 RepID=D5A9U1_PICSI|nr:unknown [Picea sitchensis]